MVPSASSPRTHRPSRGGVAALGGWLRRPDEFPDGGYLVHVSIAAAVFDLNALVGGERAVEIMADAVRSVGLVTGPVTTSERIVYGDCNHPGVSVPALGFSRKAAEATRGMLVADLAEIGRLVAPELEAALSTVISGTVSYHLERSHTVLCAGALVELVAPFAARMGFDEVEATHFGQSDGVYDGTVDGEFLWGSGKARRARLALGRHWIDPGHAGAWATSVFDLPLLSMVGAPVAVNPDPQLASLATLRKWPTLADVSASGGPGFSGSARDVVDQMVVTVLAADKWPWVRFAVDYDGLPDEPVVVVASQRSQLDAVAVAVAGARRGRVIRPLSSYAADDRTLAGFVNGLADTFSVVEVGPDPHPGALTALANGESVLVFDPSLDGGEVVDAAGLASAAGVNLVHASIEGSDAAWPPERAVPYVLNLSDPPTVRVCFRPTYG